MFSKSNSFKYESEVNLLIREATMPLNQRITMLELANQQLIQQNQKLEYDLANLHNNLYSNVQRLEKRITDFTDLWHPIMTENINRIKAELEETIKQSEKILLVSNDKPINNNFTFIGFSRQSNHNGQQFKIPILINKTSDFKQLQYTMRSEFGTRGGYDLYLSQIQMLNINEIDLIQLSDTRILLDNNEIIWNGFDRFKQARLQNQKLVDTEFNTYVEKIKEHCKRINITVKDIVFDTSFISKCY